VCVFKKLPGDTNYCRGVETFVEIAFCHVCVYAESEYASSERRSAKSAKT